MSEARTEEPTPRRERKAREEGRAWQSRDLALGAVLVTSGVLLRMGGASAIGGLRTAFERTLTAAAAPELPAPRAALEESLASSVAVVIPLLGAIVLTGAVASALQVRGLFAPGALSPDGARLDPSARFSGTAGTRMASTLAMSIARLALVLAVLVATLAEGLPGIATLSRQVPAAALDAAIGMASALALRSGLALLAIGVLDAVVERTLFRASLRMSRRDVERERREAEGDAHVRRERDRIRGELAREGDLDDARTAALLVVLPDELTIALAYDPHDDDDVPRVLAVGRGGRDEEMLREGRAHGVPIAHDEALATRLAIVPLGAPIPEDLYEPVARAMQRGARAT